MSKTAVVYWSGTGNTEAMADYVAQGINENGGEAQLIQARDFSSAQIDEFDSFAFGCPAMGSEELEEIEFLPMYDDVEPLLGDKKVVLFGSYEWADGEWMELWRSRADDAGVNVVESVIAYDYPDGDAAASCKAAGALLV